jgi:hypothetical protein
VRARAGQPSLSFAEKRVEEHFLIQKRERNKAERRETNKKKTPTFNKVFKACRVSGNEESLPSAARVKQKDALA